MRKRTKTESGRAYFVAAVLGSMGTFGLLGCGGATRDTGGHRIDDGAPHGGATADGGQNGRSGRGDTDSANQGSGSAPNGGGGASSNSGGVSSSSGGASSGTGGEPDDLPPDAGVSIRPIDLKEILGELDALHMDQDLATIVKEQCIATLSLDWDFARDGTIDVRESRIFDPAGRLVAAEIATLPEQGAKVRKRVRITYDAVGRPTRYLYGVDGDGALDRWVVQCDSPVPGLPRGTVVDIDYANDGSSIVRMGSTEYCVAYCESLAFGPGDRFVGRYRKCAGDAPDPSAIWDQVRKLDSARRPTLDRLTPRMNDNLWTSDIGYSYPAADTTVVSWTGAFGYDQSLTERFGSDGRIVRAEFHRMYDQDMGDVVTYEYDADGCGVVESTDWWNDGVADIVNTTRCTAGRVTHQEERNMTSTHEDDSFLSASSSHRAVTPLSAQHQSDVAVDFSYDPIGRLLERTWDVTTLQSNPDLPRSQHDVFSYDGASSTGTFERKGSYPWGDDRGRRKPPESSSTACTVDTTCKATPPIDGALSLCAPGVGVNSVPAPYLHVPGFAGVPIDAPWIALPDAFLGRPALREVVGY